MKHLRLRPATREERQLAMLWVAAVISALVLRPIWIVLASHFRSCTFRELTGFPCPTCGTTRCALAMLEFDPLTAFLVNPLAALVGATFVVGGAGALVWLVLGWPMPSFGIRWNRRWTIAAIAIIVINWSYLVVTH